MNKSRLGLLFGVSAYIMWGAFPLYWPLLKPASAGEIVAHRAVWTMVFCAIVLAYKKEIRATVALARRGAIALRLLASSILISINWLVYIWATNHGHVVESALGYYINPLIIIGFGVLLLKERMRPLQWTAVGIATVGVAILTIDYGRLPWIALTLALSWGTYGLVKKQLNLGALEGLAIETAFASIPYLAFLFYIHQNGSDYFGSSWKLSLLLASAGAVTAIPLLLFNGSTTRLPYSIIGLLQYITPTLQFSVGVWVYHEKMPAARWLGFFFIWAALITLATDLIRSSGAVDDSVTER